MSSITLASVEAFASRVPIKLPIQVAFGTFRDRPGVRVQVPGLAALQAFRTWPLA